MSVSKKLALLVLLSVPLAVPAQESASSPGAGLPELTDIIQKFSKRTGRKFVVDPRVRAIPIVYGIDTDKLTYEQLLLLLTVNQFVAVNQGDVTVVVPDVNARQMSTPVYTDLRFKAADDEWVTLLLEPKNACAPHLVPILRPLMPQAAHLAANLVGNDLIVADRAVNARRIATLVEKIDADTPAGRGCSEGK